MKKANKVPDESSDASDDNDEEPGQSIQLEKKPRTPTKQNRPKESSNVFKKAQYREDEEKAPFTPL